MTNDALLDDFKQHLIAAGKSPATIKNYLAMVQRFLRYVGDQPLERVSEQLSREFFAGLKGQVRVQAPACISRFLKFAAGRLPVVVTARGAESPRAMAAHSKKEIALRQRWNVDKLVSEKEAADTLVAKLARRVIADYLYFQSRQRGGEEDIDAINRMAAESAELIQSNLALFMELSAAGHNINSQINQRVQR